MLFKHLLPALGFPILLAGCTPEISGSASNLGAPMLAVRQITPKTAPSFTSKAQGFALWLPVKPTSKQQSRKVGNGETATMHIFAAPTETVNYVVIATATTPSVDMSDPRGQLDVLEKGMLTTVTAKSPGANVQKREELQLAGFAGREFKTSLLQGAAITRTRVYVTPKFFYQLIAGGPKANVEKQSAQITKVFDSFRILPQ